VEINLSPLQILPGALVERPDFVVINQWGLSRESKSESEPQGGNAIRYQYEVAEYAFSVLTISNNRVDIYTSVKKGVLQ